MTTEIPFKERAGGGGGEVVAVLLFLFFQNILWLQIVEIAVLFSGLLFFF